MELLEGEPLDARLRRHGRLSPLDAVRLIRQAADSLAAVHARGIIHRDLKPENLFAVGDPAVTGGERLKILDFGIAKLTVDDPATSRTRTGLLIGTPIYMSPEQCRCAGDIDPRSDIYSLGCVLFALLTGRPPFLHDSSGELIAAHLREPPPSVTELVPAVPRELDDVIQRCLAKHPADRHVSMQALGHALDLAAAGALLPSPARSGLHQPPGRGAPAATALRSATGESLASAVLAPARRRRRRRIVATATTVVALALVAAMLRGSVVRGSAPAALARDAAQSTSAPPGSTARVDPTSPASPPQPSFSPGDGPPASASIDEAAAHGRVPSEAVIDAGAGAGNPDAVRPSEVRPARPHRSRPRPPRAPIQAELLDDDRPRAEPSAGSDLPPPTSSPSLDFTR
jgi:serine/threonine-protein kinase